MPLKIREGCKDCLLPKWTNCTLSDEEANHCHFHLRQEGLPPRSWAKK